MKVTFIIMGAVKGGTTAVFSHLVKHPEVVTSIIKETDFFRKYVSDYEYDYDRYHNMFSFIENGIKRNYKVAGEASPGYLSTKEVPERIYRYNPEMKLIYILRDPCNRAYSEYKMQLDKWHFKTKLSPFLKEIKANPVYIERGLYAKHIENALRYFPREQLLLLKHEDLLGHGQKTMNKICDFLGISQMDINEKEIIIPITGAKWEVAKNRKPYTLKRRKTILKYFIEDIKKLEKLTGWDLTNWKKL